MQSLKNNCVSIKTKVEASNLRLLERIARMENPRAVVWRGSGIPTEQQGIKVLGTPLGHDDFVATIASWSGFHSCKMFNLHGCCSSIAHQHEQTTRSVP